jgi:hypothetical protein
MKPVTMAWLVPLFALLLLAGCSAIPAACRGLEAGQRSKCILDTATAQQNAGLCDTIQNEGFRAWCLTSVANATNSAAPCERIATPEVRDNCKREVFLAHGRVDECGGLSTAVRDGCFDSAARDTHDWRLCLNMSFTPLREACIESISREVGDPRGCLALLPSTKSRDSCIFLLSIAANSTGTCGNIIDPEMSDYCILNIAIKQRNSSICDAIETNGTLYACRQLVRNSTAQRP